MRLVFQALKHQTLLVGILQYLVPSYLTDQITMIVQRKLYNLHDPGIINL